MLADIKTVETDGIYIIDSGSCKIVNSFDNHQLSLIQRGDFFGESHELKIPVIPINLILA